MSMYISGDRQAQKMHIVSLWLLRSRKPCFTMSRVQVVENSYP